MTDYLSIDQCKRGHIYRLDSRNLKYGVFVPEKNNGFIGIRQKFGAVFLFTEHHWDNGPPHGTAKPLEGLGPVTDDRIQFEEDHPPLCRFCGERVEFQNQETWAHISGDGSCRKVQPIMPKNKALFSFLEIIEKELGGAPPPEWRDISWRTNDK